MARRSSSIAQSPYYKYAGGIRGIVRVDERPSGGWSEEHLGPWVHLTYQHLLCVGGACGKENQNDRDARARFHMGFSWWNPGKFWRKKRERREKCTPSGDAARKQPMKRCWCERGESNPHGLMTTGF